MEASQVRSYCWQRPWSSTSIPGAPVELEAASVPPSGELEGGVEVAALDGATMLNHDIRRISEKINDMTVSGTRARREYERKIENEKMKQEDFAATKRMDESYRLTESDYAQRPLPPLRTQGHAGGQHQNQHQHQGRSPSSPYAEQVFGQEGYGHGQVRYGTQSYGHQQQGYVQQSGGSRGYHHSQGNAWS